MPNISKNKYRVIPESSIIKIMSILDTIDPAPKNACMAFIDFIARKNDAKTLLTQPKATKRGCFDFLFATASYLIFFRIMIPPHF